MTFRNRIFSSLLLLTLGLTISAHAQQFAIARIYIEYNSSARDLGFHVSLDGEDWKSMAIVNPAGKVVFKVDGKAAYKQLGMTELFFEGAEPSLDEFPLESLLGLFPEGEYRFIGVTVDGETLVSNATLSHAVPDGPRVRATVGEDGVVIEWDPVTTAPAGFPVQNVEITGYQIIVESFQVTLPADATSVTLPEEFVDSLEAGEVLFEVLAIDASGNQTITEGSFLKTEE